jgi:hypothetical protein
VAPRVVGRFLFSFQNKIGAPRFEMSPRVFAANKRGTVKAEDVNRTPAGLSSTGKFVLHSKTPCENWTSTVCWSNPLARQNKTKVEKNNMD